MLVEHAEADPVLRKKLRILIAGTEGAGKLAAEIDKRIQTIGRSRSFVDCDSLKGCATRTGKRRLRPLTQSSSPSVSQ